MRNTVQLSWSNSTLLVLREWWKGRLGHLGYCDRSPVSGDRGSQVALRLEEALPAGKAAGRTGLRGKEG